MKNRKNITVCKHHQPGTPFYPYTSDGKADSASARVLPSQFRFPVLPAACTFIKNLHEDEIF